MPRGKKSESTAVDIVNGLKLARFLLDEGIGIKCLVFKIREVSDKHEARIPLTKKERFIIGLRYSEFLTDDSSAEGLWRADKMRQVYLQKLHIDAEELRIMCKNLVQLY